MNIQQHVCEVRDCERAAGLNLTSAYRRGGHVNVTVKIAQRSGDEEFPFIRHDVTAEKHNK